MILFCEGSITLLCHLCGCVDCHYLTGCRLLTIDDAPNNRKKGKWDIGNELGNCGIHSGNENKIENKE